MSYNDVQTRNARAGLNDRATAPPGPGRSSPTASILLPSLAAGRAAAAAGETFVAVVHLGRGGRLVDLASMRCPDRLLPNGAAEGEANKTHHSSPGAAPTLHRVDVNVTPDRVRMARAASGGAASSATPCGSRPDSCDGDDLASVAERFDDVALVVGRTSACLSPAVNHGLDKTRR